MKAKIYLRIARTTTGRIKVMASTKKTDVPLKTAGSSYPTYYPTIAFALIFNLPDDVFNQASKVLAEITVPEGGFDIPVDVQLKEGKHD